MTYLRSWRRTSWSLLGTADRTGPTCRRRHHLYPSSHQGWEAETRPSPAAWRCWTQRCSSCTAVSDLHTQLNIRWRCSSCTVVSDLHTHSSTLDGGVVLVLQSLTYTHSSTLDGGVVLVLQSLTYTHSSTLDGGVVLVLQSRTYTHSSTLDGGVVLVLQSLTYTHTQLNIRWRCSSCTAVSDLHTHTAQH